MENILVFLETLSLVAKVYLLSALQETGPCFIIDTLSDFFSVFTDTFVKQTVVFLSCFIRQFLRDVIGQVTLLSQEQQFFTSPGGFYSF